MNIEVLSLLSEQERITTEFEKVPLQEAIERLVRNYPHLIVSQESDRRITKIIVLDKEKEIALSRPTAQESAVKKEETSVKPETRARGEAIREESPQPKPFSFQFDPSQYGEKRR